jgi:hypothetical protein
MANAQAWRGKTRVWCEVHLGIDGQTLEIRAVDATGSDVGDAPKERQTQEGRHGSAVA